MKKEEQIALKKKLLVEIKKVLKDNKAVLRNKTEKAIKKAIKQISKNTNKEGDSVLTKNI